VAFAYVGTTAIGGVMMELFQTWKPLRHFRYR
jgi:hypothetical protein